MKNSFGRLAFLLLVFFCLLFEAHAQFEKRRLPVIAAAQFNLVSPSIFSSVEDADIIRNYVCEEIRKLGMFDIIPLNETYRYASRFNIINAYGAKHYRIYDTYSTDFILSGNIETLWKNYKLQTVSGYKIVLTITDVKTGRAYRSAAETVKPAVQSIRTGAKNLISGLFQEITFTKNDCAENYIEPYVKSYAKPYTGSYEKPYQVGDRGPGGGIVFFVKPNYSGGWRYLEAAPKDIDIRIPWGFFKYGGWLPDLPETMTYTGGGKQNTAMISRAISSGGASGAELAAAQVCLAYSNNNFRDWFLPDKDELNLLFRNLASCGIGNFWPEAYWSSTQSSRDTAWYQNFDDGRIYPNGRKSMRFRVRPIRAF